MTRLLPLLVVLALGCAGPAASPPDERGLVLEIHDVRALVGPDPPFPGGCRFGPPIDAPVEAPAASPFLDRAELERLVRRRVGLEAWAEPACVAVHRGQLIVNQTAAGQRRVQALLDELARE